MTMKRSILVVIVAVAVSCSTNPLARRAGPFGGPSPSALAIMNGSQLSTPPRAGTRVRVVVGG